MRKYTMKLNYHRMLAVFLSLCLNITMSGIYTISAKAVAASKATDAATDLVTLSAGAELASGAYYLSESKTFGNASTMNNGLKIKSGATVYIYVPEGVTLTAVGGGTNTVRQNGGYAGILLPSSSKLIILGEGNVVATGGRAGNGASGSSGNAGFITWDGDDRYYGGGGGAGGAGGGGAGAGIGTNGGNGGNGGSATGNGATKYNGNENYDGAGGNSGGAGKTASACGTLYVQTTIALTATGGLGGTSGGSGGSNGSNEWEGANDNDKWDGKQYHTAGGGGGGGGGGAGYSAYGIGTGGAGGGGGGSGGQGGIDYTTDTDHDGPKTNASCSAAGGSGGSGYYSGSSGYGTRDSGSYDGSWKKVGGIGGSGGSTGSGSSSKSALNSGWTDKAFSVAFKGTNAENIQQTSYTFGEATTTITVPSYPYTPEDGYRFMGWAISTYGTSPVDNVQLTGADNYVYQPGDSIEAGAWLSGSIVLEPVIHEIDCKVYFDDNGGNGGQGEALLKSDMTLQPNVSVPTRTGYDFLGYYTGMVNGTRYYDAMGEKVYGNAISDALSKVNLYAQWSIHSSTLVIDANGGELAGETSFTKKYNESITIGNPVDTSGNDNVFLRWVLLDSSTGDMSSNGKITTGAGYTTFTFGADTTNVTLKAVWSGPGDARLDVKEGITQDITTENLERIFLHVVADSEKGLTAEESVAEQKEVVLSIENIEVDTENDVTIQESVESIETMLENSTFETLNYYDISVNKIINGEDKGKLKELPEVVKITIELTGELADRSGYSVYRVHEGVAEQMSSSRSSEEYYEVGADAITIYTKKFSTYAITASNSVIGEWSEAELNNTNNSAATDVRGMYVDSSSTRVYKVDVEWGAMKFVFNKHQKWNPDTHSYNDEISILLDESAYEDGNNTIVVTNHSNADVRVGMSIVEQSLEGIDIFLKQQNDDASDAAVDMYLDRVSDASGDGTVSSVSAFVRLGSGTLTENAYEALTADGKTDVFQQIARMLITIEAVENSETTPLYLGNGD